jgi:hypothetical protein
MGLILLIIDIFATIFGILGLAGVFNKD